ncbi:hypothetical protein [Andreprevotia chitinilytica]|uniref:hypothetical protein n=1 Tax=Andreprevotia chitinilytica TaxID=396808 RepID=UPI000557228A|nr:hypothetical protein [Andreprevotia chitinilytica]
MVEIITEKLLAQILDLLEGESFRKASITFEVHDEGQCVLIYIPIDALPETELLSTFKRVAYRLNNLVPSREGDYSWYALFTRSGEIVESYFGGDASSPSSGL